MNDLILKKHDKNYFKSVRSMINTTREVLKFKNNLNEGCSSMSSEHLAMIIDYITLLEHTNELINTNLQSLRGNINILLEEKYELIKERDRKEEESIFWFKKYSDLDYKIMKQIETR